MQTGMLYKYKGVFMTMLYLVDYYNSTVNCLLLTMGNLQQYIFLLGLHIAYIACITVLYFKATT